MDLKYLQTRYEKGAGIVNEWMERHHRYVQLSGPSGLREAQADLTAFQNENGKGSESQNINVLVSSQMRNQRMTILLADVSVWPASRFQAAAAFKEIASNPEIWS